jgi:hypothetical protein
MSQLYGKVGIAPGTTTISIGRGGTITLLGSQNTQQDPGVTVRNAYGQLSNTYFDARPTDFEMAPRRGFLPVQRGWITGKLSGSGWGCSPRAGIRQLGEEIATESSGPGLDPDQQAAIAKFVLDQLAIEEKAQALKETRSRRFWGSIAGLAAGTTAIVAVLNYMKKS